MATELDLNNDTDVPEGQMSASDFVVYMTGTNGAQTLQKGLLPTSALDGILKDGSVAMEADLTLFQAPTADLHAATKKYVDDTVASSSGGDADTLDGQLPSFYATASDVATNTTNIATNATSISTNASNIAANDTDIANNAAAIATNVTNIATNATGITTNATNIATNVTDIATNAAAITGLGTSKLDVAGGTMTGLLTLSGAPTAANHAATKTYVDAAVAGVMSYKGGYDASGGLLDGAGAAAVLTGDTYTITGAGTLNGVAVEVGDVVVAEVDAPAAAGDWTFIQRNLADDGAFLPLAGGTLTGALTLPGAPTGALEAATKDYVDTAVAGAGGGTASSVTFTPTGSIAATDVQAALAELDTDLVALQGSAITAIVSGDGLSGDGTAGSNLVLVADPDADNILTNSASGLLAKLVPSFPLQGAGNAATSLSLALSGATGQRITTDGAGLFAPSEVHMVNWAVEGLAGTTVNANAWYARVATTIEELRFTMPSSPYGGQTQVNSGTAVVELRVNGVTQITNTWDFATDGNLKKVAAGVALTADDEVVMVITSFAGLALGEDWMSPTIGFTYTEAL